jgi:hypothetical protein
LRSLGPADPDDGKPQGGATFDIQQSLGILALSNLAAARRFAEKARAAAESREPSCRERV